MVCGQLLYRTAAGRLANSAAALACLLRPGQLRSGASEPIVVFAQFLANGSQALTLSYVLLEQALNMGIYRAIGVDGVYYGTKLGRKIPWCTSFPFNVVAHPQYVGSVMTIVGLILLLWTQGPAGLTKVALYWCSLYVVTALQEQYL